MRPIDILDSAPTHTMTFEEFETHALVACVRDGPSGRAVVDLDAPGWVGLDSVRMEAARAFGAMGFARSVAATLTTRLVAESLNFSADCQSFRLEPGRSVVLVKEAAINGRSVKDILRRAHMSILAAAEIPQASQSSAMDADALC